MSKTDHLAKARDYLAIADSGDSRREAYIRAAEEIVAHIVETGVSQASVATDIGRGRDYVGKLLAWRKAKYPEGTTPFTIPDPNGSLPTERAATSHTKKVLREADDQTLGEIVDALPRERREALGRTLQRAELAYDDPAASPPQDDGAARAVETSLDAQAASLLAQVAVVDVLLREGREFTNLDARKAERLQRDLERAIDTLGELRDRVPVPGVRAVA